MDKLELRGLEVRCVIGDLPAERDRERALTLDVALTCDFGAVCASDRVEDTVDYAVLAEAIREALRLIAETATNCGRAKRRKPS